MNIFNKFMIVVLVIGVIISMLVQVSSWENESKDVWIDGKVEIVFFMNINFNNFDINIDVMNGKVVFIGKVDSELDKEFVEEFVFSLDGVSFVDNKLMVVKNMKVKKMKVDKVDLIESDLIDVKISIVIIICYLFNLEVGGIDIDVDIDNGVVIFKGIVEFDVEK